MNKLKYAQDVLKSCDVSAGCGFNMKIMGDKKPNFQDGFYDFGRRFAGYEKAEEMIKYGKIFYTHVFKCKCGGSPFKYGGFFVCNDCGGKGVDEAWWVIKVQKDGNAWCCIGLDFVNLQESDNYAFGDTFQSAIDEYEKLMRIKKG